MSSCAYVPFSRLVSASHFNFHCLRHTWTTPGLCSARFKFKVRSLASSGDLPEPKFSQTSSAVDANKEPNARKGGILSFVHFMSASNCQFRVGPDWLKADDPDVTHHKQGRASVSVHVIGQKPWKCDYVTIEMDTQNSAPLLPRAFEWVQWVETTRLRETLSQRVTNKCFKGPDNKNATSFNLKEVDFGSSLSFNPATTPIFTGGRCS